ncbi:MAG: efflux RND transporter periplasmic adaptor subunit [Burkholderiales bacterium]
MSYKSTYIVFLLLAACSDSQQQSEEVRPAQVQKIVIGDYETKASYSGEVRARYETALGFRVGGKIVQRLVDVGSKVQKGTLLARLDPEDTQLSARGAQSQYAAAKADYQQARADLARYTELLEKKFISQAEYDRRLNTYNVARARLDQANSQLQISENQAFYTALRADQAGVVTAIEAEAGQVVAAGQVVMRIARPEEKEVVINIPENRLQELRNAKDVEISLWAQPNNIYRGKIREISPSADAATRTYAVKVAVLEAGQLMQLGMTANVFFKRELPGEIATVPLTALYQKDQQPAVWVVDAASGKVTLTSVQVGEYRENSATILAGLHNGDLVVTAGVHKLIPGQKVRVLDNPPQK